MGPMLFLRPSGVRLSQTATSVPGVASRAVAARVMTSRGMASLAGKATGNNMRVVATFGDHSMTTDEPQSLGGSDSALTPLQSFLGSLLGCKHAAGNFLSKRAKLPISRIEYTVSGDVDINMKKSQFKSVDIQGIVHASAAVSTEDLAKLESGIHRLCPLYNLLKDAGVPCTFELKMA
jgi:putative redox protein